MEHAPETVNCERIACVYVTGIIKLNNKLNEINCNENFMDFSSFVGLYTVFEFRGSVKNIIKTNIYLFESNMRLNQFKLIFFLFWFRSDRKDVDATSEDFFGGTAS